MQLTNTENRFGLISFLFHWVMAILIIGMLILGIYMTRIPISALKLELYGWHKEIGMLILMLIIFRFIWRLSVILPSLQTLPRWERIAARSVHWLFYFFMFAMPITGWLVTSAAGLPVSFFDLFTIPTLIEPSEEKLLFFSSIHQWLAYALIVVICLHVAAALKHQFIDKDDILRRMLWF
jgi:cytochrome b561